MGPRRLPQALLAAGLALLAARPAPAETLPFERYTIAEGLAHDQVPRIVQDSRGFLWLCTDEGLSRFDGYSFLNFGRADGLPGPTVLDLVESRDGTFWIGTDRGLARLDPAASSVSGGAATRPLFRAFPPPRPEAEAVRRVFEDRDGSLWVGTSDGLFLFDRRRETFEPIDLGAPATLGLQQINDLMEGPEGSLWIATRYLGLFRRLRDGTKERYLWPIEPPHGNIRAMAPDGSGGLLAGGYDGVTHLARTGGTWAVAGRWTAADGLPNDQVYAMLRLSDGRTAVATAFGMAWLLGSAREGFRVSPVGPGQGLSVTRTCALAEDLGGNLWIGTVDSGAFKLLRDGFTSYGKTDGLPGPYIHSFLRDREGRLYASTHTAELQTVLSRLGDSPFPATRVNVPRSIVGRGWGGSQLTFQDVAGDWWVPTSHGLLRFRGVATAEALATARPSAIYTRKDGLPGDEIFRIFGDSGGNVWVAASGLARWDRASGRIVPFKEESLCRPGLAPAAFGEDADGAIWMGLWSGGLARYRKGRFECFGPADGVPEGLIGAIFRDRKGHLWIGSTSDGAARIDHPEADHPTLVRITTTDGLSSDSINCFVEDRWGRIYLGTGRGVDSLDPQTGRIHHFTTRDGLAASDVQFASEDAAGRLWFGTLLGISRLTPRAPEPRPASPAWISGLSIAGVRLPLPPVGEASIEGLVLRPDQRAVEVDFVGIDFNAGERLRYEYRLEGSAQDWSAPSLERSVNFAHLSPGDYRFAVRAVNSDGVASPSPATVAFTVLRPVWQRAWFLVLAGTALAGLAALFYRQRVARAVALERVRTHIATDLHDDAGSSLSQIAILNEAAVIRMRGTGDPAGVVPLLETAAQSARDLVDVMSDLVWSVDPKRDTVADLILRMRTFADGICAARGLTLRFEAPADGSRQLGAATRRNLYLVFKESLNNAVRHAACSTIETELRLGADRLDLRIADDGRGIDPGRSSSGHGLPSMRRRSEALRGSFVVAPRPGGGTEVRLSVPV